MKFYEKLRGRGNWEEAKNAIFPRKVHKKINVSEGDYIESAMSNVSNRAQALPSRKLPLAEQLIQFCAILNL
jgi:hypothetical protein